MIRTLNACLRQSTPFARALQTSLPTAITSTKTHALSRPLFTSTNFMPTLGGSLTPSHVRKYSHNFGDAQKDCSIPDYFLQRNERASQLINAVMSGNLEAVSHALSEEEANVNQATTDGNFVLHCAAESGNPAVVLELLKHDAKINIKTLEKGNTPLHIACMLENYSVALELLEEGANFTVKNHEGYTPLDLSIIFQQQKCCTLLLYKGANVNQLNQTSGHTPLMLACHVGSFAMANLLRYSGADVNLSGHVSPLHLAANHPRILQMLLDDGARIDREVSPHSSDKERIGDSPLHTAARLGNFASVQLLLKHKSNPLHKNKHNQTPLDVARLQLHAHRVKPSNPPETTDWVCHDLDRTISLLDVAAEKLPADK